MDVVKEDMIALGIAEKDTQDRVQWGKNQNPLWRPLKLREKPKEEEEEVDIGGDCLLSRCLADWTLLRGVGGVGVKSVCLCECVG